MPTPRAANLEFSDPSVGLLLHAQDPALSSSTGLSHTPSPGESLNPGPGVKAQQRPIVLPPSSVSSAAETSRELDTHHSSRRCHLVSPPYPFFLAPEPTHGPPPMASPECTDVWLHPLLLQAGNLRPGQGVYLPQATPGVGKETLGIQTLRPGLHSCLPFGSPCVTGERGEVAVPSSWPPPHCIPPSSCNLSGCHSPRVGTCRERLG